MTTWNVTPTGTGNASLTTACAGAAPGDTISLTGRFTSIPIVPQTSGTSGNPITFQASSPGAAIFDSNGMGSVLLNIGASRSYLTFDGIAFTNSDYIKQPATNRGLILRGSHHVVQNCVMNYMQMQLDGAHDCLIQNNVWREFVANYNLATNQGYTNGDMLALLLGAHDNEITGNDMQYAGHSLIAVGEGITGHTYSTNWIHGNYLSNPWYRNMNLADFGAGTIVENNYLVNANALQYLLSTAHSGIATASNAVQIDGQDYIFRTNFISGTVGIYGVISFGGRWYTGVTPHVLVEAKNNDVSDNYIYNCQAPSVFAFVQDYTPGVDASVPDITGNLIRDNSIIGSSMTSSGAYSWDGSSHFETVLFRSFEGATPWVGLNDNGVVQNDGFSNPCFRSSYVDSAGVTTTSVVNLSTFNSSYGTPPQVNWQNSIQEFERVVPDFTPPDTPYVYVPAASGLSTSSGGGALVPPVLTSAPGPDEDDEQPA